MEPSRIIQEVQETAQALQAAGLLSDTAMAAYDPTNAVWLSIATASLLKRTRFTVAWSDEDQLYIGRSEGLAFLAAHGDTPEAAFAEIAAATRAVLEDLLLEGLADGNR
jgi:predicted RNase H-like HicB family nuclease